MPTPPLLPAVLLCATVLVAACGDTQASADAVSLEVARAGLESGRALPIDIREPEEHASGVAPGAQLLPMRQLSRRLAEIPVHRLDGQLRREAVRALLPAQGTRLDHAALRQALARADDA